MVKSTGGGGGAGGVSEIFLKSLGSMLFGQNLLRGTLYLVLLLLHFYLQVNLPWGVLWNKPLTPIPNPPPLCPMSFVHL